MSNLKVRIGSDNTLILTRPANPPVRNGYSVVLEQKEVGQIFDAVIEENLHWLFGCDFSDTEKRLLETACALEQLRKELEQVKEDHGKAQEQLALAQVEATELERRLRRCQGLTLTALCGNENEEKFLKEGDRDYSSAYGYIVELLRGYRNTQAELQRKSEQIDMRNDTICELRERLQTYTQQKEAGGPNDPLEGFHVYRLCTDRLPGPDVVVHQVDGIIFSFGKHSCSIAEEGKRMVVMKKEHASVVWELMKHFAIQSCSGAEELEPPQPLKDTSHGRFQKDCIISPLPVHFEVRDGWLELQYVQMLRDSFVLQPESVAELVDKVYLEKPGWLETTKMYQHLLGWKKSLEYCENELNKSNAQLSRVAIEHRDKVKSLEDERDMYLDAYEGLRQRHALSLTQVKFYPKALSPSEILEDSQEQG